MLASLGATNSSDTLHVHLLYDATLTARSLERLRTVALRANVCWDPVPVNESHVASLLRSDRFPHGIWYRVLAADLLPRLDRILYLDVDTLVSASLRELWDTDLRGCLLGAVTNPLRGDMTARIHRLGLDPQAYFNSGVLLIDAAGWRREQASEAVLDVARSRSGLDWPDQDALNLVLGSRRLRLHPRWNAMPELWELADRRLPYPPPEAAEARADPAIVHFIGPHKPWHFRSRHPLRAAWAAYLAGTPFAARPIEGRSPLQAVLRALPPTWAYRVDVALLGVGPAVQRERWRFSRARGRARAGLRTATRRIAGPRR